MKQIIFVIALLTLGSSVKLRGNSLSSSGKKHHQKLDNVFLQEFSDEEDYFLEENEFENYLDEKLIESDFYDDEESYLFLDEDEDSYLFLDEDEDSYLFLDEDEDSYLFSDEDEDSYLFSDEDEDSLFLDESLEDSDYYHTQKQDFYSDDEENDFIDGPHSVAFPVDEQQNVQNNLDDFWKASKAKLKEMGKWFTEKFPNILKQKFTEFKEEFIHSYRVIGAIGITTYMNRMCECKRPFKSLGGIFILALMIIAIFTGGLALAAVIPAGALVVLNKIDDIAFGGTGARDAFNYLFEYIIGKMEPKLLQDCDAKNIFIMSEATLYIRGLATANYATEKQCKKDLRDEKTDMEDTEEDKKVRAVNQKLDLIRMRELWCIDNNKYTQKDGRLEIEQGEQTRLRKMIAENKTFTEHVEVKMKTNLISEHHTYHKFEDKDFKDEDKFFLGNEGFENEDY